jgi:hypothetical protein
MMPNIYIHEHLMFERAQERQRALEQQQLLLPLSQQPVACVQRPATTSERAECIDKGDAIAAPC